MVFIKNTGRYARAFCILKNDRELKIEFDRRRYYLDTGNIATSGITKIEDEDFELLKKIRQFNSWLEDGTFTIVDGFEQVGSNAEVLRAKDEEIAKLKEQLAGKGDKANKKELEAKDKEIAGLKQQLEALSKKKDVDEAEGF